MCLLVIVKLQIIRYCEDITHFMVPIFVHFTSGHDITEIMLKVALNSVVDYSTVKSIDNRRWLIHMSLQYNIWVFFVFFLKETSVNVLRTELD
jgi:hypothetical protein